MKEEVELHIPPSGVHEKVLPREEIMEGPKAEDKNASLEEKPNEGEEIAEKSIVLGPPTT